MVWQTTAPDGTKSVKANNSILQDNTNYIKTTMNVDHFWDDDTAGNDGHHQFVQMPKSDVGGTPTDPSLAALMDGLIYAKELTSAESPSNQDVQPFYINETAGAGANPQIMRLLGIRAMCVFDVAVGGAITVQYKHNITSITRTSGGLFTAVFPTLPSENYLVLGNAIRRTATGGDTIIFNTQSANTITDVKSTTTYKFQTSTQFGNTNVLTDPLQCWFVVFGG